MADIGYFALVLALVMSLYALVCYAAGLKTKRSDLLASATGGVIGTAVFTAVAGGTLVYMLVTSDFSVEYVAMYTSTDLPTIYKLTALWAGNDGSLLLWAWVLTAVAAAVVLGKKNRDLMPYVGSVMMVVSAFFLYLLCFEANPFTKVWGMVQEGNGLNPMLQNPGMIIHPITLYFGYIGFTVPFAFAIAALITRQTDDRWIKITRKWTVLSWLFLSLGNLYGAQWAYVELGWGGYWAWDPVENASLIPWLTGSAFLHSVMVQERKNMLKIWNMFLIIITFGLTLFGTFLVRSGIVASVHSFGNSSLGAMFLIFIILVMSGSFYLLADRLKLLRQSNEFEGLISKESSFLLNNLLLVASAFSILWGTMFPVISEAVTGSKVTVGPPFFNAINAPIGLAFVLLMGICPLIAWRRTNLKNLISNFLVPMGAALAVTVALVFLGLTKTYALVTGAITSFVIAAIFQEVVKGVGVRRKMTGESLPVSTVRLLTRNRRRYGGYIIHLGIVMMIIGIAGSNIYNQEFTKTVRPGETFHTSGYSVTYNGLQQTPKANTMVVYADVEVSKDGGKPFAIKPEKVFYPTSEQPSTEPAIESTWLEDFYIILAGWEQDQSVSFKVNINPLVKWLWAGGYILVFGSIFALWPGRGSGVGAKYLARS